ncbi:putative protein kinase RLK-Pelle-DLSV family [Helianthus annuus]|uniref:Receptor-like serine/threonine-protein kinase n=1 Tax=Helianthus annuus TaxID=4232 RepID=A0A9K3HM89_HELAN|nr:putative protein kinase RLK-Pelle-DLSV family [Helianthus annuus]KAJ0508240.1 putative protein kinase RLK-Pelle-DLSV family [Helianthus annuus]KAJ0874154.1 putative protein kinase RLK-Pelle-DLSV family [Helianthus annuus]
MTKTKLFFSFVVIFASIPRTHTADTVSANQIIRYNETIISPLETFELGFFNLGNSTNYYVGIWYKKISTRTVVWVANRNTPLTSTSGELTLTCQGILILRDATRGNVLWSSENSSTTSVRNNPIGQLLDTGNFIIYEEGGGINKEDPIWQSFNFMTDTLLPGMKLGRNLVTGIDRHFTSWKSPDDPAFGEFSYGIETRGYPQLILLEDQDIKFRAGPWNGLRFTGVSNLKPNRFYNFTFVVNHKEIYYQYNLIDTSVITRLVLQPNGRVERLVWVDSKQEWKLYLARQNDLCDQYAMCGPFGSCDIVKSPVCECLKGFEPKSPDQWKITDCSQGCRHTIPLDCNPREGFNKYSNLKLPDTRGSWYNQTMTLLECEQMCKRNCSCTAYTTLNISGTGSGCLLWFDSKRSSAGIRGQVIVPIAVVVLVLLVAICLFCHFKRKKQQQQGTQSSDEDLELPLIGLSTILKATKSFSINNKLGEGGFGPVYKGVLENGKEIAVKRLAKTSTQGLHEFKNEVISISRLQHRNLVKLLGCCVEGAEVMLIYEYMPNKGLDSFIFDKTPMELVDWPARYNIIIGIARGLLYLHQDSRLRIIHRDLKVSNILLDKDMNPKISDFGTARAFGGTQTEAKTNKVVGTYGYLAPEYAGNGIFSIQSDVYSFGVVVLEIVSGLKNREFVHKEHCNNLTGHAWVLHNEDRSLELVAKCLGESSNVSQVLRSIHVALLCVQRHP